MLRRLFFFFFLKMFCLLIPAIVQFYCFSDCQNNISYKNFNCPYYIFCTGICLIFKGVGYPYLGTISSFIMSSQGKFVTKLFKYNLDEKNGWWWVLLRKWIHKNVGVFNFLWINFIVFQKINNNNNNNNNKYQQQIASLISTTSIKRNGKFKD